MLLTALIAAALAFPARAAEAPVPELPAPAEGMSAAVLPAVSFGPSFGTSFESIISGINLDKAAALPRAVAALRQDYAAQPTPQARLVLAALSQPEAQVAQTLRATDLPPAAVARALTVVAGVQKQARKSPALASQLNLARKAALASPDARSRKISRLVAQVVASWMSRDPGSLVGAGLAPAVVATANPEHQGKIVLPLKPARRGQPSSAGWLSNLKTLVIEQFLATPGNHQAFIDAIASPATKDIKLSMYHLTDQAVVQALLAKQKAGGVSIQILLDRGNLKSASTLAIAQQLQAAGITVMASSPLFSITHTKYMLINNSRVFITSINLTTMAPTTRDYGVVFTDADIAGEMLRVFAMDMKNGQSNLKSVSASENRKGDAEAQKPPPSSATPTLTQPNLVWSPVNSQQKIVDVVNSARTSLIMTVENFKNPQLQSALLSAVARGVDVRLIVPAVDLNPNPNFNVPPLQAMQNVNVGGKTVSVNSRLMPGPATAQTPYMHAKMIVVDGRTIYIGSENFTANSLDFARELGVVFMDPVTAAKLAADFEQDWAVSKPVPPAPSARKPAATTRKHGRR